MHFHLLIHFAVGTYWSYTRLDYYLRFVLKYSRLATTEISVHSMLAAQALMHKAWGFPQSSEYRISSPDDILPIMHAVPSFRNYNIEMDPYTAKLHYLIQSSRRITIFTGAGISTKSGIPDFRSPKGLWSKLQPIQYQDFVASPEMRREAWRRKIVIDEDMRNASPNRGHRAVAELVKSEKCRTVITQNIDGLHQASGVPEQNIVELHGNGTYAVCLECGLRHELGPIFEAFDRDDTLPICRRCNGIVKAATVSFGQSMPEEAMRRSEQSSLECDLFIVLGSSLVVFPAAGFPKIAKSNGALLVIVNHEETDQDGIADLTIHREIGQVLGDATNVD